MLHSTCPKRKEKELCNIMYFKLHEPREEIAKTFAETRSANLRMIGAPSRWNNRTTTITTNIPRGGYMCGD